jgi:hypothetical protein
MPSVSRNFQQCFMLYLLLWNFKCASAPPVIAPVVHEYDSTLHFWMVLHLLLLSAIMATMMMIRGAAAGSGGGAAASSLRGKSSDAFDSLLPCLPPVRDSFLSQEPSQPLSQPSVSDNNEDALNFAAACLLSRVDITDEASLLSACASNCFKEVHKDPEDDLCAMFRCEGRTADDKVCRKRSEGHGTRGMICPIHAQRSTFIKCANGCDRYCHVGCFGLKSSKAIEADNVSWNCGHCLSSVTLVAPPKDASLTIKIEGTIESQDNEGCTFESAQSLTDELRLQGFIKLTNHKNLAGVKVSYIFMCSVCDVRFTAKKCKVDDGSWFADPPLHTAQCSHNPANQKESLSTKHIMKQHEFVKKKGLLEFIEIFGACGEVRADQLARAIAKQFDGAIVEPNLLFRTATKAQERVFGKSTSDVMALQELSQRIVDGDGVCEFVYGISFCGVDTQLAQF